MGESHLKSINFYYSYFANEKQKKEIQKALREEDVKKLLKFVRLYKAEIEKNSSNVNHRLEREAVYLYERKRRFNDNKIKWS